LWTLRKFFYAASRLSSPPGPTLSRLWACPTFFSRAVYLEGCPPRPYPLVVLCSSIFSSGKSTRMKTFFLKNLKIEFCSFSCLPFFSYSSPSQYSLSLKFFYFLLPSLSFASSARTKARVAVSNFHSKKSTAGPERTNLRPSYGFSRPYPKRGATRFGSPPRWRFQQRGASGFISFFFLPFSSLVFLPSLPWPDLYQPNQLGRKVGRAPSFQAKAMNYN